MSDFDFDELDKAVSGAISPDASNNTADLIETLDTHTHEPQGSSEPAYSSRDAQGDTPQTPIAPESPVKPAAPAVRRSTGRFMDVVHPSSDMRSSASSSANSIALTKPRPQATAPESASPAARVIQDVPQPDWQKPLESPFLSDAKVEKRPLGGEAPTNVEFDPMQLLEEPDDPRIEAHAMPDPIDFAAQFDEVDPELESALEAHTSQEPELEAEPVIAEPAAAHSEIPTHDTDDSAFGYGEGSFQPEAKDDTPVGPTSITQQYQEQPSSSPESGAIYDTEAYHQPLVPVVKKKKPSFAILWIILILLLGAGAGAAFYFYIAPML